MNRVSTVQFLVFVFAIWTSLVTPAYCRGAANLPSGPSPVAAQPYQSTAGPYWAEHGRLTFGFQLGLALENSIPRDLSHINMIIAQPQIGMIVWNSPHSRLPIKRFELVSEGILGGSTHPGGELFGTSLLFRFGLKPMGRFVPYIDAGSGPVHTTIDTRASELTGSTQFLSQGGAGLQCFFAPGRAVVFEYRYFHMSNAGLQPPNPGFNG
ncbi:MAG: acyloxyacyl hydrolase, partial [Acidobacteriota bacterium]